MKFTRRAAAAVSAALLLLPALSAPASADEYLGSYVARLSERDHFASDGYRLNTAAQVVRQDRANVHRFGKIDREDEGDPWLGDADIRAYFEQLLNQGGAMSQSIRNTILRGTPLVKVDVYRNSVRVSIVGGAGSGGMLGQPEGLLKSD